MRFAALVTIFFACSSPGSSGTTADASGGNGTDGHAGGDGGAPQDSPPGPYGCHGQPTPTTAPNPATLGGSAVTISGTSEVAASGVTVKAEDASGNVLGTATTNGSGAYSMSLSTGGQALDVHLYASKSGDLDTAVYPATALYESTNGGYVVIITSSDLSLLGELSGQSQDSNKAAIGVIVVDCLGNAISGATVSTDPAGTPVYLSGGLPSSSATSTDSTGIGLVFNVPPGTVNVSAMANGMTLRSHSIEGVAGIVTTAAIEP